MDPSDLLERMARTFRSEIGPAVDAEYPKTQAYLSAVVLQKLALQLRLAGAHAAARDEDTTALLTDLRALLKAGNAPPGVQTAFATLSADDGDAGLCGFIEALYENRPALGETRFDDLLARVRQTLRQSLDRRMEIAR